MQLFTWPFPALTPNKKAHRAGALYVYISPSLIITHCFRNPENPTNKLPRKLLVEGPGFVLWLPHREECIKRTHKNLAWECLCFFCWFRAASNFHQLQQWKTEKILFIFQSLLTLLSLTLLPWPGNFQGNRWARTHHRGTVASGIVVILVESFSFRACFGGYVVFMIMPHPVSLLPNFIRICICYPELVCYLMVPLGQVKFFLLHSSQFCERVFFFI